MDAPTAETTEAGEARPTTSQPRPRQTPLN